MRDKFNIFDALVVLLSIVELSLDNGSGSSLGALRAVRIFRAFKIFRVGDLRVLMDSIGATVLGMGNYTILLILLIYLYALLGMQFFAGKFRFGDDGLYNESGKVPRENFDTIWEAFITITIIMIGDGWNFVMYNAMLSEGNGYSIYFVTLFSLGHIIMLNLFLAILLGNFESSRQLMAKKKAFEDFNKLYKKKTPLHIALVIVLGELGEYVNSNILKDDNKAEFIENIEDANIPDQNIQLRTATQKIRNKNEKEVKIDDQNIFDEEEKVPIENSKNNQDFVKMSKKSNNDDFLYNSSASSHESIDKLFETEAKVTTSRNDFILPSITKHLRLFKELPSNQQEDNPYENEQKINEKSLSDSQAFEDKKDSSISSDNKEESSNSENQEVHLASIKHEKGKPKKKSETPSSESNPEEFKDSTDEVEVKATSLFHKVWKYMNESSLLIFHESWSIRQWLLLLVISTESLTSQIPKSLKRDSTNLMRSSRRQALKGPGRLFNNNDMNRSSDSLSQQTNTNTSNSFDDDLQSAAKWDEVYHLGDLKIVRGRIITTKTKIKYSRWFENAIIVFIILNSLALILDNPIKDPDGWLRKSLSYLDIFFTLVFAIEAAMKIVALGFFCSRLPGISGYIVNGWNILDFAIVCASLVDLSFTLSGSGGAQSLSSLKALRAFRALRPLRVISRNEGLQLVINTLFSSIPAMTNVMLVTILILLIFAIMGVNFFKGEFYQ